MGLAVILLAGVLLAPPPSPESVRRAAEETYSHGTWQKDLPGEAGPWDDADRPDDRPDTPPDPSKPRHARRGHTGAPRDQDLPDEPGRPSGSDGGAGGAAQALLWVVLGVVALVALSALFAAVRSRAPPPAAAVVPVASGARAASPAAAPPPLDEIDALAARGRYAEAIHLVLRRAFAGLVAAGRTEVAVPSFTSREAVARATLSTDARSAMDGLVLAVEVSHFGGVPPSRDDYVACRERLARVLAGRPAAAAP